MEADAAEIAELKSSLVSSKESSEAALRRAQQELDQAESDAAERLEAEQSISSSRATEVQSLQAELESLRGERAHLKSAAEYLTGQLEQQSAENSELTVRVSSDAMELARLRSLIESGDAHRQSLESSIDRVRVRVGLSVMVEMVTGWIVMWL